MNLPTSPKRPDLNYQELDYLLDKTKAKVFMGKRSGFFGSIMSSLNFFWDEGIGTAATNGTSIKWNPYFFLALTEAGRVTVLKHELKHVAYMDCLRIGTRDPLIWNYACDIRINNELDVEGEAVGTTDVKIRLWLDHQYDGQSPEEIYEAILPEGIDELQEKYGGLGGEFDQSKGDIFEPDEPSEAFPEPIDKWTVLNNLIAAVQSSKMTGGSGAGDVPGETETVLQRFLSPKLPWNQLMFNWFNAEYQQDYSFRKPNRRFQDIYLPSLVEDIGGLDHILFGGDVSGSVSDSEFTRYTSEVKYIKDHFDPELLTFFQFDTVIQSVKTWHQNEPFDEVVRKGYGGTDLRCVRELILEKRPTAVVILSDLQCAPMDPIGKEFPVPILWVAVNNFGAAVNEGKLIHMRD